MLNLREKLLIRYFLFRKRSYHAAKCSTHYLTWEMDNFKSVPFTKRIEAYRKGYSYLTYQFKLKNPERFLIPEHKYYQLHPVNGYFTKWMDDKLSMKYLLKPFDEYLPKYYFHSSKGIIHCLDESTEAVGSPESVVSKLKEVKLLACKPTYGTAGVGFVRFEYTDGKFSINHEIVSEQELKTTISGLENHILTEYLWPAEVFKKINPFTSSSIRVVTVRKDHETHVVAAFMRFGTSKSKGVDNMYAGGILVPVNHKTGELKGFGMVNGKMSYTMIQEHPETHMPFNVRAENWEMMVDVLKEMGNFHPQLEYLGYDVVMTDDGFKILEINTMQEMINFECHYDEDVDPIFREYFAEKLKALEES